MEAIFGVELKRAKGRQTSRSRKGQIDVLRKLQGLGSEQEQRQEGQVLRVVADFINHLVTGF